MKVKKLYISTFLKENYGQNSTKVWITKFEDCIVANNSEIPENDLNKILKAIRCNFFYIVSEWKNFYDVNETDFFY